MLEQELRNNASKEEDTATNRLELTETRKLLSPCNIGEEDTSHLAVDDLKFALEQTDSRNIAVTGHYGSGKSSVVNTCIDEMGVGDKVLRISMSTFSLQNDTKPNDLYSDDIEYKIVQHLLYKCDKTKIPYSRFQLIQHIDKALLERYIILTIIAFCCFIIAFEPKAFQIASFYEAYDWIFGLFGKKTGPTIGNVVKTIADAGCIAYLLWFVYKVGVKLADKINRFRNFKFEAQGVSLEASTEVSVFNKYLDEIIYILQANHYNYILFEDLDRLANSDKLFLKIRELNMLINESETFKRTNRIVRFIYAIRDDVFTRELRTKSFDYIVAVVPVVDHYNVTDYLIKEYQKKGLFKTIDTVVLEQLLSRVSGLRELKNIVNEYILFQKSLKTHLSDDDENYEQKLLAVIVYKNLFPQDFAKAYSKSGLFYTVFQNKSQFIEDEIRGLREKKETAIQSMNEVRNKIVDVRKKYLEKLNEEVEVKSLIKDGYDYTLGQVASKDNLFDLFLNDDFDRYTYQDHNREESGSNTYNFEFDEIEKKVTEDMGYYEAIDDLLQTYNRSNEERIKHEKEIKVIENTALREILKKIGGEKARIVFNQIYIQEYPAKDNEMQTVNPEMIDTLMTMIYGGYIAEDYYLYISKFYEGATSESDYQFTNAILQGTERPYDQKINSPKSIIRKLRVEDFKNKSILNYDILNFLFDNKEEHFLTSFIETARSNPEFIVSYFLMADKVNDQFFTRVFDGWDSCVNVIKGQEKAENSEALLKLFLRESPVSVKLSDDEIKYLEGKYEFVDANIQFLKLAKLKRFVQKYDVSFETLVKPNKNSQDLYEYCLTSKHFVISKRNLEVILGDDFSKKPMTAIMGLTNDKLKKYLLNNEKSIVAWFGLTSKEENREALVYMMNEELAAEEWMAKYLNNQQFVFNDVSDLDKRAVELIFNADKLAVTWKTVLGAYQVQGALTDSLNRYLTRHATALSKEKCVGDMTLVTSLHKQLFIGEKQPITEFKQLMRSFDLFFTLDELKEMTDERIMEVIKQKKINADTDIFTYLNTDCSDEVADEYLILCFDDLLNDENINWEELMRNSMGIHVLNSKLTLEQKKRFLDEQLVITKGETNTGELAKLVCFYYNQCGVVEADKEVVVDALTCYQEADGWESKIKLINKCNATWSYDKEIENKMLKEGLGGEYEKLTYARGWANFDINEYNSTLLDYLKNRGHYVNKFEEKNGQYYVTFKHS